MNLNLYSDCADNYSSNSQKIRILTENWVSEYIFCPSCGLIVNKYKNNCPVRDFYCQNCNEDYELKSKKNKMGKKIPVGAYSKMVESLERSFPPNFFFLNYDKNSLNVSNFVVIPKHFFTLDMIEERKPLSASAKRAGWIGCNILLETIPYSGKIFYIKDSQVQSKNEIIDNWNKTSFLKESKSFDAKGWLLDIMKCIEKMNKNSFSLQEIYQFEKYLQHKHPNNNNIQAKIRQQLQLLRDKNYLEFSNRGYYKLR